MPIDQTQSVMMNPVIHKDNAPPGWWKLPLLKGTRIGVIGQIDKAEIPQYVRDCPVAEVKDSANKHPEFNFYAVDCHCQFHEGRRTLHLSIIPSKVLIS